jgi:prevent-host-death family protein
MTRHIKASEFKAKCLSLLDEVQDTGESIIVTKRGKPVARLEPVKRKPKTLFGAMKGHITIKGDIVGPLGDWDEPD